MASSSETWVRCLHFFARMRFGMVVVDWAGYAQKFKRPVHHRRVAPHRRRKVSGVIEAIDSLETP